MSAPQKNDSIPTPRVFISSTRSDMLKYREKIQDSVLRAECFPVGMERFSANNSPAIDVCFEQMETCQIYLCALGMRYGDVIPEYGKSYTELEFDRAEGLGLPMLVFFIDEDNASFKLSEVETGEGAERLKLFKEKIRNSRSVTCDYFSTPDELGTKVLHAIQNYKDSKAKLLNKDSYIDGAKLFRKFVTRPAKYKNTEATLRVRFDGDYGGWRIRDEVVKAFGFEPGFVLFMNDLFTLGIKPNVDEKDWALDCFAEEDAADWLEDNDIEPGTIFEGVFKFAYEMVPNGAGVRGTSAAVDAYIANLILMKGLKVISRDVKVRSSNDQVNDYTSILPFGTVLE